MGLSAKNKEILFNPLSKDNPVIVQMLGICSALAVTVKLQPALVMAISVTAVVAFANVIISNCSDRAHCSVSALSRKPSTMQATSTTA